MNLYKKISEGFSSLRLRDQAIAVSAFAVILGLLGNLFLIKPQNIQINSLRQAEETHRKELGQLKQQLDIIRMEQEKGIDPFANERALLAEYARKLQMVETFFADNGDGSVSEVGLLVRSVIRSNNALKLVSMRTLPAALFYAPPKAEAPKTGVAGVSDDFQKMLKKSQSASGAQQPQTVALVNKPYFKHGVEVVVKGTYPALMTYVNDLQGYSKRIFWADTVIDAKNHEEATLRLTLFILSDKQVQPLQ